LRSSAAPFPARRGCGTHPGAGLADPESRACRSYRENFQKAAPSAQARPWRARLSGFRGTDGDSMPERASVPVVGVRRPRLRSL